MKVTVKKIAEIAKVSRGTVDRVLHDRPGVNEDVKKRVLDIVETLGYTPNLAGKALVSQDKNLSIGVVLAPDFHPFVSELKIGIQEAGQQIKSFGVKTDIEVVKTLDAAEQIRILDALEKTDIAGLAIVPIDDDSIRRRLKDFSSRGIPVVTFNSDIRDAGRIGFVGQDNVKAGRTAYGLLETILPEGGRIAVITSGKELECHQCRLSGFRKRREESKSPLSVVSIDENQDEDDRAFDIVMSYRERYPDLTGIYLTGGGASGMGKALKLAGMSEQVKVVSHDRVPPVIDLMEQGIIKFTICQNPREQGALPILLLFDYIFKKKSPEREMNYTGVDIRTVDNL